MRSPDDSDGVEIQFPLDVSAYSQPPLYYAEGFGLTYVVKDFLNEADVPAMDEADVGTKARDKGESLMAKDTA